MLKTVRKSWLEFKNSKELFAGWVLWNRPVRIMKVTTFSKWIYWSSWHRCQSTKTFM